MFPTLDRQNREVLLRAYADSQAARAAAGDQARRRRQRFYEDLPEDRASERHLARMREIQEQYDDLLPRVPMGCCPLDGKVLMRSFDPFGLDGLWWRADASPREMPACPHFCCLAGAVNFEGQPPQAGRFDVHPGPEAPYVIPRLLEMGLVAVISRIRMDNGATAYPIAYFGPQRPAPQKLAANWPRPLFTYRTQFGLSFWRGQAERWDFDLAAWLAKGLVRWCPPDGDNTALSGEGASSCPYADLPGLRQALIVRGRQVWHAGGDGGTRG